MENKVISGIQACLIPSRKFKTNSICISFIAPLSEKDASYNALLCNVLRRGSAAYPSLTDLNIRLEELYGANLFTQIRKKGDFQLVTLGVEFLDNSLALSGEDLFSEAAELLFGLILEPHLPGGCFDPAYVESEKTNLIDYINAKINDKRAYAVSRCFELMCAGEPFGLDEHGKTGIVSAIDPCSLFEHYKAFVSRTPMVVCCVGRYDENVLSKKLSRFKSGARGRVPVARPEKKRPSSVREFTDIMEVEQAKLSMGFRSSVTCADGADSVAALSLFNAVFGGSPHSKLFENVRERLSLCYYCASRPERFKGAMIVYSGVEDKNIALAREEILRQLERIQKGDISDGELDAAVKTQVNAYKSALDSPASMEDFYVSQLIAGDSSTIEEMAKRVAAVTKERISEVARGMVLDTVYVLRGAKGGEGA